MYRIEIQIKVDGRCKGQTAEVASRLYKNRNKPSGDEDIYSLQINQFIGIEQASEEYANGASETVTTFVCKEWDMQKQRHDRQGTQSYKRELPMAELLRSRHGTDNRLLHDGSKVQTQPHASTAG